jgi:hypothetical protein
MTAVLKRQDQEALGPPQRTTTRRKLRLEAPGSITSDGGVLILDISTTGLLIKMTGDLAIGETFEVDLPEAPGVRLTAKWSSGPLFGCEFSKPVSAATVSAALLRAPVEPRLAPAATYADEVVDDASEAIESAELPFPVRMRWIAGLTLASWGLVAAPVLAWSYIS